MVFQIPEDKNAPPPTSKEQIELWEIEKEKLLKLEAGKEIDDLIALKVYDFVGVLGPKSYSLHVECSIRACEKVGLFDDLNVLLGKDSDGNWSVIYEGQDYTTVIAAAKELPLALCRAILSVIFDREHPVITPRSTFIGPIAGNAF